MKLFGVEEAEAKRRSVWSWVLSALLAAALLWWALRGVEWKRVAGIIGHAEWKLVLAAAATTCLSLFLRSLRWRILLNAAGRLSIGMVFSANNAGYLGNNFLPARAGELIRSFLISSRSKLSRTYVLTTALSERLMDVIALVLWSSLLLLGVHPKPRWMTDLSRTLALVAGVGGGGDGRVTAQRPVAGDRAEEDPRAGTSAGSPDQPRRPGSFRSGGLSRLAPADRLWGIDYSHLAVGCRRRDGDGPGTRFAITLCDGFPATGWLGPGERFAVYTRLRRNLSVRSGYGAFPVWLGRDSAVALILAVQATNYAVVLALGLPGLYRMQARSKTGKAAHS